MRTLQARLRDNLIKAALSAMENAYAPYSNFRVGAALLAGGGDVFAGCNVENASFGLTICAERCAICAAATAGIRKFRALAIVGSGPDIPFPCGACRQVLNEFCGPDMPVFMAASSSPFSCRAIALGELLPHPFALRRT